MSHKFNCGAVFFHLWILLLSSVFLLPSGVWAADPIKEIRIADGKGDWGYPNPYRQYPRGPGYLRMAYVFDSLVWKDAEGYIPALATSWRYDPDSLSFIFKLQKGVLWHDGKPFSAKDVAFTIHYFKKQPYQWVALDKVSGAEALGPTRSPSISRNPTPLSWLTSGEPCPFCPATSGKR